MKKNLGLISIFLIGLGLGLIIYYFSFPPFYTLSMEDMHQQVISQRDMAISKAQAEGIYDCCVSPACTMCYMEANSWNNHQAGQCDCADFIIRGEEPCPQCKRLLAQEHDEACELEVECEE